LAEAALAAGSRPQPKLHRYSGVGVERLAEVADALAMEVTETVSYALPVLPA